MANFLAAYQRTMINEGGYCNVKGDKGGETYKGIARLINPQWQGWSIIDQLKTSATFPKNCKDNTLLESQVQNFYQINYWNKIDGNSIPNQDLAEVLFDIAVNMGVSTPGKFLQTALNYLNRSGSLYPDIVVDGQIGPGTLNSLNSYLKTDSISLLIKTIGILQGCRYLEIMKSNPSQEKFARGWINRIRL